MAWLFSDPPNVAVIVNKRIIQSQKWVAYVSHDIDDGSWQFHISDTDPLSESDAAVISLREMVQIDSTIEVLADLPIGWHAWRKSKDSPWTRAMNG